MSSYSLSDFILFSETTYYRQFELYNLAVWPLHLIAVLFLLLILYTLWKKPVWSGQLNAMLLVIAWVWIAWAFLYQRFYLIHVVANWYAWVFVLQAGLIAWYGLVKKQLIICRKSLLRISLSFVLLFISFILYPFLALLSGRSWLQFEMFALAPDPTVLGTIAILLINKAPRFLYVIPVLWGVISYSTLLVMSS